jgi:hypothetical protein
MVISEKARISPAEVKKTTGLRPSFCGFEEVSRVVIVFLCFLTTE